MSTATRRAPSSAALPSAWTPTRWSGARSSPGGWIAPTSRATGPPWSRPPATTGHPTRSSPSWSGCRKGSPSSGSATSCGRWAIRPRPDPTDAAGTGSGPGGRVVLFFMGDLLRATTAEQPRAGEPLHHLAHVLHGVEQVVDVLADVVHR